MGMFSSFDSHAMRRALALSRRGSGCTHPNPLVGAVVAKGSKIVGVGWHRVAGGAHAEVEALNDAGSNASNATLYVTLEPCNHVGRTPACVSAIVEARIARVVVAVRDPNPAVDGGGVEALRQAGIIVDVGLCSDEAYQVNAAWFHWIKTGRPFVVLKFAVSLDGKLATASGDSQWISSAPSRAQVHRMRRHVNVVMVGVGTVISDNPRLTNRTGKGRQPKRVIVDSQLRVPISAEVFKRFVGSTGEHGEEVLSTVVTIDSTDSLEKQRALESVGADVLRVEEENGRVSLGALLQSLGEQGVQSILCEGGAELGTSLLEQGLVDRLVLYHCPRLVGEDGKGFFVGHGCRAIADSIHLKCVRSQRVGDDIMSTYVSGN